MKKFNTVLTALLLIGSTITGISAHGQGNCNLINSVTLSVPDSIQFRGFVQHAENAERFPMELNEWQYMAITIDGNSVAKAYKNGQLVATGPMIDYPDFPYSWSRIDLGARYYTGYEFWFNGEIDEIRMSNTVRSPSAIEDHYNSGQPFTADANTIGLWHLDQGSGNTIPAVVGSAGSVVNGKRPVNHLL